MDDLTANSTNTLRRRTWLVLGALIFGHVAFNLILNPIGATEENVTEFSALPLMGAIIAQPVLFATWAAIGPGRAVLRIPLSAVASLIVYFASIPRNWNILSTHVLDAEEIAEAMLLDVALLGATFVILLLVGKFFSWKIACFEEISNAESGGNQFSLKFLIALTGICAVLLVIGRTVAAGNFWSESSFWRDVSSTVLTFGGIVLLALFPMLIIPLIAIARRPSVRPVFVTPFLWAGLTLLAVEVLSAQHGEPRRDVARQVMLLQGGAAAAGMLSAAAVRFAGYRLVKFRNP